MTERCSFHGNNECSVLTRHCPVQQKDWIDWGSSTEINDSPPAILVALWCIAVMTCAASGLSLVIVKLASGGGF